MINDVEPCILERWRVVKCKRRASDTSWAVYAYGYCAKEDAGFITSPILKWNEKTAIISTQGGDRFHLSGEPGNSRDASQAWQRFVERYRIEAANIVDVSERYVVKKGRAA
jgi:hypothetical protein